MTDDSCVFIFLRRNVSGKRLMRFQGENSVFKFLRRSVDGARKTCTLKNQKEDGFWKILILSEAPSTLSRRNLKTEISR